MRRKKRPDTYPKGYLMRGMTLRMIVSLIDIANNDLEDSPFHNVHTRAALRRRGLIEDNGELTAYGRVFLPAVVTEYARLRSKS